MFAVARILLIVFAVLTVIYISLSLYARKGCKDRLRDSWEPSKGSLEEYMAQGLQDYDQSLRKRLILGVYVVPILLFFLIVYLTNYA